MKAEELMIGDWVEFVGPDDGFHEFHSIEQEDFYGGDKFFQCFSPVEITPRILLANSFRIHNEKYEDPVYLFDTDDTEITISREGYVVPWRVRIQRGPEASVSIRARYCHELQHALRIMGLDVLADNYCKP